MKENSKEEDIECIQEFLEYSQDMINDMDYERPVDVTIYQNQINSLEHILSDYKRVLEENEELKHKYDKALSDVIAGVNLDNTYISKQKIQDKIEELKEKPLKIKVNNKYYYETDVYNKIIIQVLQELLKEDKQ